jgi:heptosyltransferase-1
MPRILLVKTSSLGDIVHNLPVASDIALALPGAQIDWVVEESMSAVAALHVCVQRVIPVAVRRWRRTPCSSNTLREIGAFLEDLRSARYDAIIDTQGLFKSALIARAARGRRYGFGWRTSREPLFAFYNHTFDVSRDLHAVERNRILAARALAYERPPHVEYRIRSERREFPLLTGEYAALLHATSAGSKLWPEDYWIDLGRIFDKQGVRSVLPWGSEEERARSARLADSIPGAVVPQRMGLRDIASLLAGARCAIGVDTGLTHLAGALGIATVGIYVATDPKKTGLHGCARATNLGGPAQIPGVDQVLQALRTLAQ